MLFHEAMPNCSGHCKRNGLNDSEVDIRVGIFEYVVLGQTVDDLGSYDANDPHLSVDRAKFGVLLICFYQLSSDAS